MALSIRNSYHSIAKVMLRSAMASLLLIFPNINARAQAEDKMLRKADSLVAAKKYNSAFKLLNSYDSNNGKPAIVLKKADIALNYFVSSIGFETFCFKDLEKDETLNKYRRSAGNHDMYAFRINHVLDSLVQANPGNFDLYQGLGKYYYQVHMKYEDGLGKSTAQLFNLMEYHFNAAIEHNAGDYESHYILGYVSLSRKYYREAIPHLLSSLELNKDFAPASYNLAFAYLYSNDRANTLKYAKLAHDLYQDPAFKADAARMTAVAYSELKDLGNAINYYTISDREDPNNYYTLKPLLTLYLITNDTLSNTILPRFFALDPENPAIYNDLAKIYFENDKASQLLDFYLLKNQAADNSKVVSGNLLFYIAELYMESNKLMAKEYFIRARRQFATVYASSNPVFDVIDNAIKKTAP